MGVVVEGGIMMAYKKMCSAGGDGRLDGEDGRRPHHTHLHHGGGG